ncbi:MAG: GNAT family N-acetyltransferase [Candidatus Thorarchaeota archaeon]
MVSKIYNYAEVLVRRAEIGEVEQVRAIIKEAYAGVKRKLSREPGALREGLDKIARHIQMGNVYVAVIGGQIVGTMRVVLHGQVGIISRVAVKKAYRGRRIGTALVEYAENLLVHMNAQTIEIEVYGAIEEQREFYVRLGYEEVGRHEREGEEIVVMRKELIEEEGQEEEPL